MNAVLEKISLINDIFITLRNIKIIEKGTVDDYMS